ncbi:H(+)/Cl(-) exchange transporter ClcA [Anatilimnocola aggregata]|uniref:H(+)/Cl(-) exchange transporter ClcA n=1 Tax=Anatilimnocola aggregata TaxID=2528021 RepID=A0A517YBC2_9BACT|nr:voltage-gated chloride channel family protein [Anatilimnocola aggregata]QDU27479.1 H(+)/Cl(-) exchange transporter ClcA [Anatilimnocola aggregata]
MPYRWVLREHLQLAGFLVKWLALAIPLGVVIGSAVALFLWSLDRATELRWEHPWLLYLLPLAGAAIALLYQYLGKESEAGNNLILDEIHEPAAGVPLRMAPLVFVGTILTHLFGGSAGREGTAVQMGGSLASQYARWLRSNSEDARLLLMAGIAAGFGAVFGTPLTGAIFALEVLALGQMNYRAMLPCLIASIVGDYTTSAWGIGHTHYSIHALTQVGLIEHAPRLNWWLAGKVTIAAACFGLCSVLFAEFAHSLHHWFKRTIRWPALRPLVGGLIVIALVWTVGNRDYLGLGVNADPATPQAVTIQSCFRPGGAEWFSWAWKILFTVVTISSGFKGGEVTPLFFIGAALGHVLGLLLGVPVDFMAGLGFVAVFAGATNTPLACTIMGIELFAPGNGELLQSGFVVYLAIACYVSYFLSGHTGIYLSQRVGSPLTSSFEHFSAGSIRSIRDGRTGGTNFPAEEKTELENKTKSGPESGAKNS